MGIGGVLGGAATGAALGSVIPGVGTAVGAAGGGLLGLLSSSGGDNKQVQAAQLAGQEERRKRFADAIQQAQQRTESGSPFLQAQHGLVGQLQQSAAGQGPSIAEQQMKAAQEQNLAQALAMGASARGNQNPAMIQRQLMAQQAAGGQQIAQAAGIARLQEQQGAQQQLASLAAQGRQGDLAFQQAKDQLALQYEQLGLSADQAQLMAEIEAQKINSGVAQSNAAYDRQLMGGAISGISTLAASGALGGGRVAQNGVSSEGAIGSTPLNYAGTGGDTGGYGSVLASRNALA